MQTDVTLYVDIMEMIIHFHFYTDFTYMIIFIFAHFIDVHFTTMVTAGLYRTHIITVTPTS